MLAWEKAVLEYLLETGDAIVIVLGGGESVTVRILDIKGDTIRLEFNYPRHVPIHRKEVFDAIQTAIRRECLKE